MRTPAEKARRAAEREQRAGQLPSAKARVIELLRDVPRENLIDALEGQLLEVAIAAVKGAR